MKKIINGKLYDTETAELLATNASECGQHDFRWFEEDLYRTKKGQFFLAGEGGPMSRWSHSIDQNSWSGGSDIVLFSDEEAREWAEASLTADEIEELACFPIEEG